MGEMLFDSARHTIAQANIDAKRITTASGNKKRAAIAAEGEAVQSIGNQNKANAAGRDVSNISENVARNLDAAAYGKLGSRVAAAEELGASVAQAAAAGVGGSSVQAYNDTMRLHQDMSEEQGDRQVIQQTTLAARQQGDAIKNAVASFGNTVQAADIDTSQFVDDHKMSTLTKIVGTAATVAATYFGGPQAGEAVQNFIGANNKAANGDFAGAAKSIGQGLTNAEGGFKTYTAGADDTHSGEAWGANAFKSFGANFHI